MLDLPVGCLVKRPIPKKTFYEKLEISSSVKDDFVNLIDRIEWEYKISEDLVGIKKTQEVEEIEIFLIQLKTDKIPERCLKIISNNIPYKILFCIEYNDKHCLAIKANDNIYFTEWNEMINLNFKGLSLEEVYQNIVLQIIKEDKDSKVTFDEQMKRKEKMEELQNEINVLAVKVQKETQFQKKYELNSILKEKKKELDRWKIIN